MDTAQRTSDAALGGLGRGDAVQLRAEDWGAAGGLRGSAAPRNGRQKSRPPPRPEEVWEMHARREGEGREGRGRRRSARAEVAIPAQLHGTVTGPEDPQSRASGDPGQDHREWVLRSLAPGWG